MMDRRKRRTCGLIIVAYGCLAHLLLVGLYSRGWVGRTKQPFIWQYGSAGFVTFGGAAIFFALMRGSVMRVVEQTRPRISIFILKGSLIAVLATLATLGTLYVLAGVILTLSAQSVGPRQGSVLEMLVLALMDIHLYGIPLMIATVPFDLCYGFLGSLLLVWACRRAGSPT